jgi:hypothetical protein
VGDLASLTCAGSFEITFNAEYVNPLSLVLVKDSGTKAIISANPYALSNISPYTSGSKVAVTLSKNDLSSISYNIGNIEIGFVETSYDTMIVTPNVTIVSDATTPFNYYFTTSTPTTDAPDKSELISLLQNVNQNNTLDQA